ncbi:hypothetical protein [uncultured Ruminococcus sp.]|uniref:hypothetical protein n=1 Tax=uncultured Ruminococcus sp. TaxID=165186 RepID=UPI0025D5A458|nr:hypothetical protein [uncultured Ruminococcus sp.]
MNVDKMGIRFLVWECRTAVWTAPRTPTIAHCSIAGDCAANAHYRSLFYRGGLRRERRLSFTVLSRGTAPRTPTIVHCSIAGDCAANAENATLFG